MRNAFDRAICQVQWRCHLNLLLECWLLGLLVAGAAVAGAVLVERVFAIHYIQPWMLGAVLGLATAGAAVAWLVRRTDRMGAAILIDKRLRLRERFSTALALHDSDDPFAQAACAEAHQSAQKVHLAGRFPILVSRRWMQTLASWTVAAAVFFFLPTLDVLGYGRAEQERKDQAKKLDEVKAEVKKELTQVSMVVNKLGEKDMAAELAKIDQAAQEGLKPEDIKLNAVKKLEELIQELDKKSGSKLDKMKDLQDRLKGIRGSPEGLGNELNRALAAGKMQKVAEMIKDLQKKIDEGKLDPARQDALQKQLKDLAEQLDKLAKNDKDLEDELEKAGLNKDAADMDADKLREALAKRGLTQEQIDDLMRKIASSKSAQQAMRKLAAAMRNAGQCQGEGALAGELDDLAEQLTEMEALLQDAELAEAGLNELKKCMGRLGRCCGIGDGDCEGVGLWAEGDAFGRSRGTGGPGIGQGQRPSDDSGDVAYEKTKAPSPTKDGPAIASTFIKGSQVRGESAKELRDIMQASKDAAAEAISENQIPKKYEGAIKEYFGQMDKNSD